MNFKDDFYCIENVFFDNDNKSDNFTINFEGDSHVFTEGVAYTSKGPMWSNSKKTYSCKDVSDTEKDVTVLAEDIGVQVTQHYKMFSSGNAVRLYNTVKNVGDVTRSIPNFSSGRLKIVNDGSLMDEDRFVIHWCKSGWVGEAQWKHGSFLEIGMTPQYSGTSGTINRFTLRSEGSWSTSRYYPILILEDKEKNEAYFIEHEGACTWQIHLAKWPDMLLEAGSCDFNHDGWYLKLNPGEEYSTTSVIMGRVKGGFEEAVRELTKAKRESSVAPHRDAKLYYNVFMGGIWEKCSDKTVLPLVDACSELGVEGFCIDAGWFREKWPNTRFGVGDYVPSEDRFGEMKLEGVLKYMTDRNIEPGLWFEFEATDTVAKGAKNGEKMLKRNGTVISKTRGFYDMTDEEVREHLFSDVERVYNMGMRFIKNDYNYSTGIGVGDGDYNENNKRQMEAVYSFIDELYRRFPGLTVENCGSGAMRSDNGTLSHFNIQSTSDQERYYHYASIGAGSLALMPPEKAGIWVYPYASYPWENDKLVDGKDVEATLKTLLEREGNPETVIYAMVNGMLGNMYLSGRLDLMTEESKSLVKRAIDIYKSNREFIANAYPVFPTGMGTIGRRQFITAGLTDEQSNELKLCVWKQNAKEDTVSIDLNKYVGNDAKITLTYPENADYTFKDGVLTLTLKGEPYMARYFEIKK